MLFPNISDQYAMKDVTASTFNVKKVQFLIHSIISLPVGIAYRARYVFDGKLSLHSYVKGKMIKPGAIKAINTNVTPNLPFCLKAPPNSLIHDFGNIEKLEIYGVLTTFMINERPGSSREFLNMLKEHKVFYVYAMKYKVRDGWISSIDASYNWNSSLLTHVFNGCSLKNVVLSNHYQSSTVNPNKMAPFSFFAWQQRWSKFKSDKIPDNMLRPWIVYLKPLMYGQSYIIIHKDQNHLENTLIRRIPKGDDDDYSQ